MFSFNSDYMKMKRLFYQFSFAFLALGLFSGCLKSSNPSNNDTNTTTVSNFLKTADNAGTFYNALVRTNLDTVLNGVGPFTVLVPTDAVFTASGITADVINNYSDATLRNILLYHTIGAALVSTSFPAGPNSPIIAANGDTLFVTFNGSYIYVNGALLTQTDIFASNGVIHAISQVLIPPTGSILQTLQTDTTYSYLNAAITRASQNGSGLDSLLSNGSPLTLFAPTNAAFQAAGYTSIDSVNNTNIDSLYNILSYHILPGRTFTSDIVNGQSKSALNGGTLAFSIAGSSTLIKGNQNQTSATLVKTNAVMKNGVIHTVDQVLKP